MRPRRFAIVGCLFALCDPVRANNSLVVNTPLDGHDVNGCTPGVCTLRDAIDANSGNAIYAPGAIATAADAIVGAQPGVAQCEGAVAAAIGTANLDEDSSCGFTLHDTFANLFRPLDISTATLPGFTPTWHSNLIDAAASCMDLMPATVGKDQHDTHRPRGAQCDLGAIEADYVFVDGLE